MNTLEIAQSVNEDDLKLMREPNDMHWNDKKDNESFLKVQEIHRKQQHYLQLRILNKIRNY